MMIALIMGVFFILFATLGGGEKPSESLGESLQGIPLSYLKRIAKATAEANAAELKVLAGELERLGHGDAAEELRQAADQLREMQRIPTVAAPPAGARPEPTPVILAPPGAVPISPPTRPTPKKAGRRTLRRGMRGDDVKLAQSQLREAGFSPGKLDGIFGVKTESAVKSFQRANPPLEVDGVIGPLTRFALDDAPYPELPVTDIPVVSTPPAGAVEVPEVVDEVRSPGLPPLVSEPPPGAIEAIGEAIGEVVDMVTTMPVATPPPGAVELPTVPTPPPAAVEVKLPRKRPTLRRGSKGPDVTQLQQMLTDIAGATAMAGIDPKGVDGKFGPATAAAVRAYQRSEGLDVDGVVGPQTWGSLDSVFRGESGPKAISA